METDGPDSPSESAPQQLMTYRTGTPVSALETVKVNLYPIMDGEHPKGWASRLASLNGLSSAICMEMWLSGNSVDMAWIGTTHLDRIVASTGDAFSSNEELIDRHTLWPLLMFCASDERRTEMHTFAHSSLGHRRHDTHPLAGMFVDAPLALGWCVQCAEEDFAARGFTYWRREFLIPGAGFCARHQRRLQMPCGLCNWSRDRRLLGRMPGPECWCGRPLRIKPSPLFEDSLALDLEITNTLTALLNTDLHRRYSHRQVVRAFRQQLTELGLLNQRGIDRIALTDWLKSRVGVEVLGRLGSTGSGSHTWYARLLGNYSGCSRPVSNGLLVHLLFESVQGLEQCLSNFRTEGHSAMAPRPGYGYSEDKRDQFRSALLTLAMSKPHCSRSLIWVLQSHKTRWLLRHDRAWLDANFPVASGAKPGAAMNMLRQQAELQHDRKLVEYVATMARQLRDDKTLPVRLTQAALINGFRYIDQFRRDPARFPLGTKAIVLEMDTDESFAARLLLWAERHELELMHTRREKFAFIAAKLHISRSELIARFEVAQNALAGE